jgi:signal transduction histidine kinase
VFASESAAGESSSTDVLVTSNDAEALWASDRRLRVDPSRDGTRLSVLADLSLLLTSAGDHLSVLRQLADIVVPALCDWCVVHTLVGGHIERVTLRHADPSRIEMAELFAQTTDPDPDGRGVARVFATGESLHHAHVSDAMLAHLLPSQRDALRALGLGSIIAVPLTVRGQVIAALTLVRADASHAYDVDDLEFAKELGRRGGTFVENALLLHDVELRELELRDQANRLETLNRIGHELASIHDVDEVVKRVCEAATVLTQADVGLYVTWDEGEPKYSLIGATFEEAELVARRTHELVHGSPALALRRPLRVDDVSRASSAPLGVLSGISRITSYLAVPVRGRRGDVIGSIAIASSRPRAFDGRAEQLVTGLASLTATATESARLFRQAHELITALETSNHDLDQFAYVASHDLRAPLRAISNLGRWIEEDLGDALTETSAGYLKLLKRRVQRLDDLIQGILDYSRAGRVPDAPQDIDTGVLVREVLEMLEVPAGVSIDIDPRMPLLHTTHVPLQQVFMNLIANALRHGGSASPRLEIGAEPISEGWELYVRDNGPGVPARFHTQIWELFQTLQPRDVVESTGIGLAIVRRIVEAHGGNAWIDSEEGRGATFRFTWPNEAPRTRSWDRHVRKP